MDCRNRNRLFANVLHLIIGAALLSSVQTTCDIVMDDIRMHITSPHLLSAYRSATLNASNPTHSKISTNLFAITQANKRLIWKTIDGEDYLLVVNLAEDDRKYLGNPVRVLDSIVWITVVPELIELCANYLIENPHANISDIGLRLSQSLGLPGINIGYTLIEFWVRPKDLFRPCPDPEIDDDRCDLSFPANVPEEHREWINSLRATTYADAYKGIEYGGYPWTQLGYTYDWRPETTNNVGPSEYVIKKGSKVYVNKIYNLMEYCRNGK